MRSSVASPRLNVGNIREHAQGRWPSILNALGMEVGTGEHRPCPTCGGQDRFRFDDQDGRGTWFCNQCDPHAGDGFALVMNVRDCSFPEALQVVTSVLGLTTSSHKAHPHPAPKPIPMDRVKLAFKLDMAALDRQLRAKRIFEAAQGLAVLSLSEADLDLALACVAQACADLKRAALLEGVADDLRARHFSERKAREQQTCAA